MFFEQAETEIKERLEAKLPAEFEAKIMPEKEGEYRTGFAKPRAWVCYLESDFQPIQSTDAVSQHETMQFEINLQSKLLRGTNGIYNLLNEVRLALIGFQPTGCDKIYAIKFQPMERVESVFIYQFIIACRTLMVEKPDDVNEVTFQQIDVNGSINGNPQDN